MGVGAVIQKGEAMTERVTAATAVWYTISPMVLRNAGLPVTRKSRFVPPSQ